MTNKENEKSSHNQKFPPKLGELLVKQGFVKPEGIQKALSIQEREKGLQKLPLGQILLEMGALTKSNLEYLRTHPDIKKPIGTLAVEKGFISYDALESCLQTKKTHELTGKYLIEKGLLSNDQLQELLIEQINTPRFGELAIKLKLISEKDLNKALRIQKYSRKIGEILCDLNLLKPMDLNHVLNKYNKQLSLCDILFSLGYINQEQSEEVRQLANSIPDGLGKVLLKKQYITEEQLHFALSKQYNIPFRNLHGFTYDEKDKKPLTSIISQKFAETKMILPISLEKNNLTIALLKPEQMVQTVYDLKGTFSNFHISCILITKEKFEEIFEILYSKRLGGLEGDEEEEIEGTSKDIDFMEIDLNEEIEENNSEVPFYSAQDIEAEELVNFIVKYGIVNNASDIHIEQDRDGVTLRYRLDGVLREPNIVWLKKKLRSKVGAVISRIKVMSNLDIAERRLPQDGVFRINYYDKGDGKRFDLDFRVATCHASVGENVTIRILDSRKANVGLDNLNHSPHVLEPFKTLLKSSAGMILVCGPTGSGKSSTLYAALQYVFSPGIKIITAEDPIEYSFPGIMQTQVNPKINLNFARFLRSFLRFDPDVILVGEIRDEETAKISFDAAQTGHLLLSTLHTNDAVSVIPRLMDLDVEYGQISSSLMCVLAQRLVRRICPSCSQEYIPGEDEWGTLFNKYPSHLKFYKGRGCPACNFSGYKGRTLISEVFVVDSEIALALNKGYDEDQIRRLALESGMKTMIEDGLQKLDQTTLAEIIRMVPHDMIKTFRSRQRSQKEADLLIENLSDDGKTPHQKEEHAMKTFHLYNPETEEPKLDLMKSQYMKLAFGKDGPSDGKGINLFKEFITNSFYEICEKYNCKSVNFGIQKNRDNGKVTISAIPES